MNHESTLSHIHFKLSENPSNSWIFIYQHKKLPPSWILVLNYSTNVNDSMRVFCSTYISSFTKIHSILLIWMNEWMNGVLGHDSALFKLYWGRDNLGEWDEFCSESCPWSKCFWSESIKYSWLLIIKKNKNGCHLEL